MTKLVTIQTTDVHEAFAKKGFTPQQVCSILHGLVSMWRVNERVEEITREVIINELGEDDLIASFIWNETGKSLITTGNYLKQLSTAHLLTRWSVVPFAIMLEFDDGQAG